MELKEYIFPIFSGGTIVGQGFLADGYFITAAHVVKDFPSSFTIIKGKRFGFSNFYPDKHPIFIGEGNIHHDPKMIDIAIYPYDDIKSPLTLSSYIPQKGDRFDSCSMYEVMDFTSLNPSCKLKMVTASAWGEEEGNYFFCDCKQFGGSSGGPLIRGNEVVGIMHGGNEDGLCAFLKANAVSKIISRKELSLEYDEWDLEQAWEYEGCKYSKERKRLLEGTDNTILQGTIVICNEAFYREDYRGNGYGMASGNIIIPNTVKKIGEKAFAWSDELESIEIPDSVVQIGKDAFDSCHFLKKVILSNSITEIPASLFSYCQSLTEIIIPNSVTKIGMEAFENCDSLTNLIIPSSVKCIEPLAFCECTSLTQVIFLGTVEKIDDCIFEGCSSLSQVLIPSGTFDIYKEMLPDFTDILVEDEYIGNVANPFEWSPIGDKFTIEEICEATGMFSLNDVDGDEAEIVAAEFSDGSTPLRIAIPFKDGSNIELKVGTNILNSYDEGDKIHLSLIYGQQLHKVGKSDIVRYDVWESEEEKDRYLRKRDGEELSNEVTEGERLNTEVTEEDFTNAWTDDHGVMYSKERKRLLRAPQKIVSYAILEGTKVICDNAFSECRDLQSVVIPNSVTAIGDFAFYNCGHLVSAKIPKSVTYMGICVFEGCERIPHYHPFE